MKIVCIGGGPSGLYFALLMKRANPAHDITVVERNKPYDTFGRGVVFSDATLANMRRCDPQSACRRNEIQSLACAASGSARPAGCCSARGPCAARR